MTQIEPPPTNARPAVDVDTSRNAALRYHPLVQLVIARVKEFYRHPSAIFWVYIFPILMTIVLGVAFRNPQQQSFVIDIEDTAPAAKEVAAALAAGGSDAATALFHPQVVSPDEARQRLRTGRSALVVIPVVEGAAAGAGPSEVHPLTMPSPTRGEGEESDRSPTRGEGGKSEAHEFAQLRAARYSYLFDPTRPESQAARWAVDDALQRAAGRDEPLRVSDEKFAEPGSRYIDFLVPGLIGASLMNGALWGIGFIVVDMRVRKLLKRFVTTPMKKSDFLLGLMLSRFMFIVTEVVLLLLAAWLLFDVAVMGSWLALVVLVFAGAWTFAGIGLLVACRAQTLETASGIINLVMLPMWLVSGIFFSSERFPAVVQPVIKALPLTAIINGLRAVMIDGASLDRLGLELLVLAVWSAVSFFVSLRLFRWY